MSLRHLSRRPKPLQEMLEEILILGFIVMVILIACAIIAGRVDATELDQGVTYLCGTTTFNLSMALSVDNLQLYDHEIVLNQSAYTLTPSVGTLWATINPYSKTLINITETTSQAATVTHTLEDVQPSINFNVYKDGTLEGSATSTGGGVLSYTTGSFTGKSTFVFKAESGGFVVALTAPADGQQFEYSPTLNVNYSATASSPNTVQNVTLYDNRSGSWTRYTDNLTAGDGVKGLGNLSGLGLVKILWGAYGCDQSGCNWSTTNSTYNVVDTTPPTQGLELNASTIEADNEDCIEGRYNATDYFPVTSVARWMQGPTIFLANASTNGTLTFCYNNSVGLGGYQFNVTSTDSSGNKASRNLSAVVRDTIAPRVTLTLNWSALELGRDCVDIYGHSVDAFPSTFSLNVTNATGQITSYTNSPSSGGHTTYCPAEGTGLGTFSINLTATDSSNNKNSTITTFTVAKTLNLTTHQISPAAGATFTLGQTSTILRCNTTGYVAARNFTFTFDGSSTANATVSAGNFSSLTATWGPAEFGTHNWSCSSWDNFGGYSSSGNRSFTYTTTSIVLGCNWTGNLSLGAVNSAVYTNDGVNISIEAYSNQSFGTIFCTAYSHDYGCGYSVTNASSAVFPVSNAPLATCNLTIYTPRGQQGNLSIQATTSPAFNSSSIGDVNYTVTKMVRRYFTFGFANTTG